MNATTRNVRTCMGIVPDQNVLVFVDGLGRQDLAEFASVARLGSYCKCWERIRVLAMHVIARRIC